MPSDVFLHGMNAVHRVVLALSRGRLGWNVWHMPVVELTTIGRKSGQRRTVMLTAPHQEGDTYVLVASRGGDDHHPAWFLNLQANPEVDVRIGGGESRRMLATVADAAERQRLWPLVTADHSNYADYQARTSREIPLVLLRPASTG